jgi:uncharacterized protein YkwD
MAAAVAVSGFLSLPVSADDDKDAPKFSKEEQTAIQTLVDLTNKARAKEKLSPVKVNALIVKAAYGHSANMAKQRKLAHDLDGKSVKERLDDVKYDWETCGENVGNLDRLALAQALFDGWMKSAEHRRNILDGKFEEVGIAIVRDPQGKLFYVTQNFGTLSK